VTNKDKRQKGKDKSEGMRKGKKYVDRTTSNQQPATKLYTHAD
jgi:hypothetical protein